MAKYAVKPAYIRADGTVVAYDVYRIFLGMRFWVDYSNSARSPQEAIDQYLQMNKEVYFGG